MERQPTLEEIFLAIIGHGKVPEPGEVHHDIAKAGQP